MRSRKGVMTMRLTWDKPTGEWGLVGMDLKDVPRWLYGHILRLHHYEQTGLSPEDVEECCSDEVAEVAKLFRQLISSGEYVRLLDLAAADKDGRLVVLPCKMDATVYVPLAGRALPYEVISCSANSDRILLKAIHGLQHVHMFYADDVGKSVFLTQAEAEAAIEENKP